MSGKTRKNEPPADDITHLEGETVAIVRPADDGLTACERARIRIKCVEAAMIIRTVQQPVKALIDNAREIEAYALEPAAAPDAGADDAPEDGADKEI